MYYGLIKQEHLLDYVKEVCNVLGNGKNNNADLLILGTLAQETHLGQYKDHTPNRAGQSIAQFDKMPFYDVVDRTSEKNRKICINEWNIDIKNIEWREIWNTPFLAIVFTRLKYKLVPDNIPYGLDAMAKYYKKWYNSTEGKATPEEFIGNYMLYVTPLLSKYKKL